MKIKKFNETKISLVEFKEIALEALTFITDDFKYEEDNNYLEIWESDSFFFVTIHILFNFYENEDIGFNERVNQIQDCKHNYETYDERANFWKAATLTKNQLDSIFEDVSFMGKDLFGRKYPLIIRCKK